MARNRLNGMRRLVSILLVALGLSACGRVENDPPPPGGEDPPVSGDECSDEGATAPAGDDCNTCTCQGGSWLCTRLACLPPDEPCEDGSTTPSEDGCNTCTCQDGDWLCTAMPCIEPVCEDGATVTDNGCNSCTCSNGEWVCSDVYCPPACEDGTVKAAGDGCNSCSCEAGQWLCTDQACAQPECPLLLEQTCQGGLLFGRAAGTDACCTICSSLPGYTYYESLEACEASKVCVTGETKYADDQCNTCTCQWDGTWACTAADCEPVYCGGLGGQACADDEYCAYQANEGGCGIGDANAICRPRPSGCTKESAPVCGCDGETYANECLANQAGSGVLADGACAE